MDSISQSLVAGRLTRGYLTAMTAALFASALSFGAQAAFADSDATQDTDNAAVTLDAECAQHDLDVITLIERNGDYGLSTTATLVEASELAERAREACEIGEIDIGLELYDTALRLLENPSDLAQRLRANPAELITPAPAAPRA